MNCSSALMLITHKQDKVFAVLCCVCIFDWQSILSHWKIFIHFICCLFCRSFGVFFFVWSFVCDKLKRCCGNNNRFNGHCPVNYFHFCHILWGYTHTHTHVHVAARMNYFLFIFCVKIQRKIQSQANRLKLNSMNSKRNQSVISIDKKLRRKKK